MVPTAKAEPGVWVLVKLITVPSSVAVGSTQVTVASQSPTVLACVIEVGQLTIVGAVLSITVMTKLQLAD